jgi:nitroreductase
MPNQIAQLIKNHRSIRKYKDEPIPDEVLNEILTAAQWASTSNNFQAYSVIVVRDTEARKRVSELSKSQRWIETCPVFLVFCIDYFRLYLACEKNGVDFNMDQVDNLIVGCVDTTLAAENAYLMANAYGLGGVIIGAIRNNAAELSEFLKLPKYVIPLIGMALGYPDEEPLQKPRLPLKGVAHQEFYQVDNTIAAIEEYETITEEYYTERTNGERTEGWGKIISTHFLKQKRPHMKDFIIRQGFNVK